MQTERELQLLILQTAASKYLNRTRDCMASDLQITLVKPEFWHDALAAEH